jgi:hypothetical protein
MKNEVKNIFYKPGTTKLNKERILSTIVFIVILIIIGLFNKNNNLKSDLDRRTNPKYTIGSTLRQYKNFRSPNPSVKYRIEVDNKELEEFEEIPDFLNGKIIIEGGRYYVQLSSKNPSNCKLLLEYPVPDSISEAPDHGWVYMPGYGKKPESTNEQFFTLDEHTEYMNFWNAFMRIFKK